MATPSFAAWCGPMEHPSKADGGRPLPTSFRLIQSRAVRRLRGRLAMSLSIAELQTQRRWVLWRLEMVRNTRGELVPTKVPYRVGGAHASSTDPATWCTFAQAQAAVGSFTGVGVVM